ncbi:N-alpha-acetyltransferase 38, NatC auxiliary subunit [Phlyctochytrium planicorne]|nr:N-alpha-acetyltransferase 38, NatC auxiliary subunit [Phlyctochytrium planicorne]
MGEIIGNHREWLSELLNLKARITTTDKRAFVGIFICVDKDRNIILTGTDEFKAGERRFVGMVMIPGKHIIKAEIEDTGGYS